MSEAQSPRERDCPKWTAVAKSIFPLVYANASLSLFIEVHVMRREGFPRGPCVRIPSSVICGSLERVTFFPVFSLPLPLYPLEYPPSRIDCPLFSRFARIGWRKGRGGGGGGKERQTEREKQKMWQAKSADRPRHCLLGTSIHAGDTCMWKKKRKKRERKEKMVESTVRLTMSCLVGGLGMCQSMDAVGSDRYTIRSASSV